MPANRRFWRERNGVVRDIVWTKGKRYVGKLPFQARVKWGCERCRLDKGKAISRQAAVFGENEAGVLDRISFRTKERRYA